MPLPTTDAHDPLGHRPALDGVRALAITTVMIAHSKIPGLPGGGVGVDLFFVLSGFLITTLLLEEQERRGRVDVIAFYARRALRLGPALVALLAGIWLLSFVPALAESTPGEVARFSVYVMTYTSNWMLALQRGHTPSLLGHLWSLAVEEQFYLAWPLLLVLAIRLRVRPRAMLAGLLALVAALALWRAVTWHRTHDVYRVYFATDCRASGLLLGSALGVLRGMGVRAGARLSVALVLAGVALYAWTAVHPDHQTSYPLLLGLKLVEVAATALIAGTAFGAPGPHSALFASAPLVWIGRRSYAMYLWHVPMLYVAYHMLPGGAAFTTAAGFALTLAVTMLSWRFVEQPALRRKSRFERRPALVVPVPA